MSKKKHYRAVVVGVSMGGVEALTVLLGGLPKDFPLPLLIVHHISADAVSDLASMLNSHCAIRVKEADAEETIAPGTAYLAPPNYHLLVERDGTVALSVDVPVNFARPSIDVLFESAADAFGPGVIGVILTGAGSDGAKGLSMLKDKRGLAVIQDPADADADSMPRSALAAVEADHVLPLKEMARLLCTLAEKEYGKAEEGCPMVKEQRDDRTR